LKDKYFIVKVNDERKITLSGGGSRKGSGDRQKNATKKPGEPGWRNELGVAWDQAMVTFLSR
jgi:hypothetical protein